MTNINEITIGMTPQDKEIYFQHMEKRHREEAEKIELEKTQLRTYKENLVADILKDNVMYTYDELMKMSVRTLERIYYYLAEK